MPSRRAPPAHSSSRIVGAALTLLLVAIGPAPTFAGETPRGLVLLLRNTENGRVTDFRITINGEMARLERVGETRPPSPVNLIHQKTGALTIVRPHNRLVTTLPGAAFDSPPTGEGGPGAPAGIGAMPTPPGTPAPGASTPHPTPGAPVRIGPDPSLLPGGESIPGLPPGLKMPDLSALPGPPGGQPAPGVGPGFAPGGGPDPGVPPAAIPAGFAGGGPGFMSGENIGKLAPTDETREIHGYACRRHALGLGPNLELELWLSDSKDFPPFYLLAWDGPPRFGPRDPLMSWPHVVRRAGQFPLLAILRQSEPVFAIPPVAAPGENPPPRPPGREMARWEVVSIAPATPDPSLFAIPEAYLDTAPPKP